MYDRLYIRVLLGTCVRCLLQHWLALSFVWHALIGVRVKSYRSSQSECGRAYEESLDTAFPFLAYIVKQIGVNEGCIRSVLQRSGLYNCSCVPPFFADFFLLLLLLLLLLTITQVFKANSLWLLRGISQFERHSLLRCIQAVILLTCLLPRCYFLSSVPLPL